MQDIAGSTIAKGIDTITFTVKNNEGNRNLISLDNVIHLPEVAKNQILISQWSRSKRDNCGVMSNGDHSTFMWDNDSSTRLVLHSPECSIPLMPVNEDNYTAFIKRHSDKMLDNICLLHDGVCKSEELAGAIEADKQSVEIVPVLRPDCAIPTGAIAKVTLEGDKKICIITKEYTKGNGS